MLWFKQPVAREDLDTRTPEQKAMDNRHGLSDKGLAQRQHDMMVSHGLLDPNKRAKSEEDARRALADEPRRAQAKRELEEYYERVHGIPCDRKGAGASSRRTSSKGWIGMGLLGAAALGIGIAAGNAGSRGHRKDTDLQSRKK